MDVSTIQVLEDTVKMVVVECTNIGFPRGLPENQLREYVSKELVKLVKYVKETVHGNLEGMLLILCLDNMDLSMESWELVTFEYLSGSSHYGIRDILLCQKEQSTDIKNIINYAKSNANCKNFISQAANLKGYNYDPDFKESLIKDILLNVFKESDLTENEIELLLESCTSLEELIEVLIERDAY